MHQIADSLYRLYLNGALFNFAYGKIYKHLVLSYDDDDDDNGSDVTTVITLLLLRLLLLLMMMVIIKMHDCNYCYCYFYYHYFNYYSLSILL